MACRRIYYRLLNTEYVLVTFALTCVLWPFLVANVHLPFTRFPGFLAQSFKEPSLTHEARPMFP